MEIEYSIISRGQMVVTVGEKSFFINGELTFSPPVFYADIKSVSHWNPPFNDEKITEEEKVKIVEFITKDSVNNIGTEVVFEG